MGRRNGCALRRATALLAALVLAVPLISAPAAGDAKVRVGLLSDTSCTDERSREAAWRVLGEHADFAPRHVTAAEIREGEALRALDVLILPGGTGGGQGKAPGVEGGRRVTEFTAGSGAAAARAGDGRARSRGAMTPAAAERTTPWPLTT